MPDLLAAGGFAAFLTITWLLAGDQGHHGIAPGQADDSDVHRRLP